MMATSEQELLGTDLGKYFSEIADKRGKNSEGRNRMHALFLSLLKKTSKDNLAKAERIRKHNPVFDTKITGSPECFRL